MKCRQTTKYGSVYKYTTFDFDVPEFKELLDDGTGYLVTHWGGKQWLYLPHENQDRALPGAGNFTIVIKTRMTYMDKLTKANKRKNQKEAKDENRNASES
jgi:hypothetical protein